MRSIRTRKSIALRRLCSPVSANELQGRVIDGISRLACPSSECGFVHWNNPIPVVAGLIYRDGKYIIARNTKWPSGMFSLVTGFLEKDETPDQAILREAQEELGVLGKNVEFIGHYALPELNQLIMAFAVEGHGEIRLSDEIAEIKVLSQSELSMYDFGRLDLTSKIVAQWLKMPNTAFERATPKAAHPSIEY